MGATYNFFIKAVLQAYGSLVLNTEYAPVNLGCRFQ